MSECLLLLSSTNKVILYNNLNKFEAYKLESGKNFNDLDVATILGGTKVTDKDSFDFSDDQSHWIWMIQDAVTYKDIAVSKNLVIRATSDSLDKSSYASGDINSFIDKNEIVLQLRRKQVLGL